jgi:ABC-type multidrug transport system fused ATPase/permease subunit
MGLHSLRQHISVIPQTPFIFRGSIRENIDPFNLRTDEEVWQSLEDSDLAESVRLVHFLLIQDGKEAEYRCF